MTLLHPENLSAAAPVCGNFNSRCINESIISKIDSDKRLPIASFYGENDENWKNIVLKQDREARNMALKHGYQNISVRAVAGKAHVPLPKEVLNYFFSLTKIQGGLTQ